MKLSITLNPMCEPMIMEISMLAMKNGMIGLVFCCFAGIIRTPPNYLFILFSQKYSNWWEANTKIVLHVTYFSPTPQMLCLCVAGCDDMPIVHLHSDFELLSHSYRVYHKHPPNNQSDAAPILSILVFFAPR